MKTKTLVFVSDAIVYMKLTKYMKLLQIVFPNSNPNSKHTHLTHTVVNHYCVRRTLSDP